MRYLVLKWPSTAVTCAAAHLPCGGKQILTHFFCRAQSHAKLVQGVTQLAARVQADPMLSSLIRRKFAIKCTTGYSLNALVDFPLSDPIEIIKRLIIGSEGTLGFVSRATYNTVPEWPHKVPSPAFARCFFYCHQGPAALSPKCPEKTLLGGWGFS